MLGLALMLATAQASDLVVAVDADVTHVALQCGAERLEQAVARTADGRTGATFPIRPGRDCDVVLTRKVGTLEQLGTWRCDAGGCVQEAGAGMDLGEVPSGTIKLLLATETTHDQAELTCPSGYRERAALVDRVATFTGVPGAGNCTVNFKGGPPLKYVGLASGGWECHIVSNTPVCQEQ